MLKIDNLVFNYGKIQALKGVSFEVQQGEILSIVGANGAGKSTLLKCISGLLKPQSGEVSYDGEVLPRTANAVVAKGIAMVPEGRWIFPNLTVEENLLMGGYLSKNRGEGLERAYSMFKRLKERRSQRAGTMSGGEQQMLAIARGLMANPKVLILDEPITGLDPMAIQEFYTMLRRLNREDGVAILMVSHDLRNAVEEANKILHLQKQVLFYGPAHDYMNSQAAGHFFHEKEQGRCKPTAGCHTVKLHMHKEEKS